MNTFPEFLRDQLRQTFRRLAAYGIATLFVIQLVMGFPQFQWNLAGPMLEPHRTTDEKLYSAWGKFYEVAQFIRHQTEEDAVILIDSGYLYSNLFLYFLYPRQLFFGGEAILRNHPEINWILLTQDFPNFNVAGEKIMLDDQHGLLRIAK